MLSRYFPIGKGDRWVRSPRSVWRRFGLRGFCLLVAIALTTALCTPGFAAKQSPKPKPQQWQIDGIAAALTDERSDVNATALKKLTQYSSQALESLMKQDVAERVGKILKDEQQNSYIRGNAVEALSALGDDAKPFILDLVNLVKDEQQDADLRNKAITTLVNLGDVSKPFIPDLTRVRTKNDNKLFISNFLNQLRDKKQDTMQRSMAAMMLSNLVDQNDIKSFAADFLDFIKDEQQDPMVRSVVVGVLGNLGDAAKPFILDLVTLLRDEQQPYAVRGSVARVLGNLGDAAKPFVSDLISLLKDKHQPSDVRLGAAVALVKLKDDHNSLISEFRNIIKDEQQPSEVRSGVIEVLGNMADITNPTISDFANLLKDKKQAPSVRGSAAKALSNMGDAAKPFVTDIANLLKDEQQDYSVRGSAAEALGNMGDTAKPFILDILNFIRDGRFAPYDQDKVTAALDNLGKLSLDHILQLLSIAYEDGSSAAEWRFDAYFFSGGSGEVTYLLKWIAKPKQVPEKLDRIEGTKTLEVFEKAWKGSETLPSLREDLANKTARVAKLVTWQTTDLPLLQQHYNNLKTADSANADSVQAAITALETWQWLSTFRTVILTHAAFWLALIFAYPRSPQIQAIFFWNPWVRNILGVGYVPFLLAWIPFLRRKLFEPFQPSLLADAGLANFSPALYFSNSTVQIGDVNQAIAIALPHLKGQIILEGDSGLGKTMFVRHLLKQSKRIAVYLPAIKCTEGVIEAIQKKLHGDEIKDPKFLQSLIYSGAIDIYIDGLNEVSADTRAKIAAFVESHFRGNILITTQPLEWNPPATAKNYVLQPLQSHQIEAYLLSRQPFLPKTAPVRGEDYQQACRDFSQAIAAASFAPEERQAIYSILSNPMELTLAAWILADNQQPNLFNLRQQQYDLMAADYQRMWNRDFPLNPFSEAVYQLRLADQQAIPAAEFYKELQCMEDEKYRMVISRQWQDAKGEAQKEWVFRHDKIAEFFIVQTFLGNSDEAKNRLQSHIGDSRFRGVYFLLATLLPIDAAQQLREDLINYAADTKDHTVSDTFVQLMRSRKAIPIS